MDVSGWFSPHQGPRVRFRAMTESHNLVDEMGEVVDTQVIAHSAGIAMMDRPHVSLYKLKGHDSLPVYDSDIVVETGLAGHPMMQDRWGIEDAKHIWEGYAGGTIEVAKAKFNFDAKTLRFLTLITGAATFVLCVVFSIVLASTGPDDAPPPPNAAAVEADTQGADHGFVTEREGAEATGEASPAEDSARGAGGAGSPAEDSPGSTGGALDGGAGGQAGPADRRPEGRGAPAESGPRREPGGEQAPGRAAETGAQ